MMVNDGLTMVNELAVDRIGQILEEYSLT